MTYYDTNCQAGLPVFRPKSVCEMENRFVLIMFFIDQASCTVKPSANNTWMPSQTCPSPCSSTTGVGKDRNRNGKRDKIELAELDYGKHALRNKEVPTYFETAKGMCLMRRALYNTTVCLLRPLPISPSKKINFFVLRSRLFASHLQRSLS